jgi:hypothetical protein
MHMRKPYLPVLPRSCPHCGVVFKPRQNVVKFCSSACQYAFRTTPDALVYNFWSKVEKRGDSECWGWKAQKRWDGYGRWRHLGRAVFAHRFSYELHHGPIPQGMHVLHSCDNPGCTNPKHLRLGTHDENMAEMAAKGRSNGGLPSKRKPKINPERVHP